MDYFVWSAQGKTEEKKKTMRKYSVKPPRDLHSTFEKHQEEKRHTEAKAAALKEQLEAERLQKVRYRMFQWNSDFSFAFSPVPSKQEKERPPPDPLLGLRVHSWVLVLSGNREVPENFFIDPLTGKSYSTTNENFLGIESIWNHKNYWVNKQDCTFGCEVRIS